MFSRRRLEATSVLALAATAQAAPAAGSAPCDLYSSGGTPCVAAHSTTRALYSAFNGALYQVKRGSDNTTTNVGVLAAGGVANAATQDNFCSGTTCLVSIIYDQSGRGNHLTQAPPGGAAHGPQAGGYDDLAAPLGAAVTLNGKKAYGVFIAPGSGYRNNNPSGTATGDAAQGMYAVIDGTHYNDQCCFDYGNAETSSTDTGNGHMEAIYFGDNTYWGSGSGNGPWIMADLENGLFSGSGYHQNTQDQTITNRFTTAVVKGEPGTWAIRGGNAATGSLSTFFNGGRPADGGYNPMSKEGAILLGIGGDNSNSAQGTFYEGVMTTGYPTDATENAVQANIVNAKYAVTSLASGTALTVGKDYSFRVTTPGYDTRYLAHNGSTVNTQVVTSSSPSLLQQQATWVVRSGLVSSATGCVSFESKDTPGSFIRHYGFQLQVNANDGSKQFSEDATFCPEKGVNGQGDSFRSWSYPGKYFRHYNNQGYLASNGGPAHFWDSANSFNNDVSFTVAAGFV